MPAATAQRTPTAFNEANSSKAMASCAGSSPRLLMLLAFSWDQCTAWNSSSAHPTSIRVSMGSQAFMSLTWLVLACYRESCATNDERRESAPRAVAWVATGDSCGRLGGFFCVPCVRAATRADAGAPIG